EGCMLLVDDDEVIADGAEYLDHLRRREFQERAEHPRTCVETLLERYKARADFVGHGLPRWACTAGKNKGSTLFIGTGVRPLSASARYFSERNGARAGLFLSAKRSAKAFAAAGAVRPDRLIQEGHRSHHCRIRPSSPAR